MKTAIERFLYKIAINTDSCWEWQNGLFTNGYGEFWNGERSIAAHRFSHEWFRGLIPEGLEPDHLCRNRKCVNPDHLELVTHRENILRGIGSASQKARQTHCIHGHPFDEENTYYFPSGRRNCRACARKHQRLLRMGRKLNS